MTTCTKPEIVSRGKITIILGLSGAGKDTLAGMLGGTVVKFASRAKRMLEMCYGLFPGALDDRDFRNNLVPGTDFSYLDALVRAMEVWPRIDPRLTIRPAVKEIMELNAEGQDVVITDMRSVEEWKALTEAFEAESVMISDYLYVYHLYGRKEEVALPSDSRLLEIKAAIDNYIPKDLCVADVYNGGNPEDMLRYVEYLEGRD